MSRVLCVLGAAAALVAALAVGPSPAGTADLAVRGGLPCNTEKNYPKDCPGTCTATYQAYNAGKAMLCAEYVDPQQCYVSGCTVSFNSIQCTGECTK